MSLAYLYSILLDIEGLFIKIKYEGTAVPKYQNYVNQKSYFLMEANNSIASTYSW